MQEISYTKKYYEIYEVGEVWRADENGKCNLAESQNLLFVVETKEVAEDFCKRHKNCTYKEYSVQVATGTTGTGVCVVD